MKKTHNEIAVRIVEALRDHSAPGSSTWGDNHPDAHAELFNRYEEDLVADVEEILKDESEEK